MNAKNQIVTTKLEVVYNILRENIVNGNLEPGSKLVIKKIAKDLGVSEIPVREAIRLLEAQGLVNMTPHTGAQVSKLDVTELEEVLSIRSVLEGYAARTAVPLIDSQAVEGLHILVEKMRVCVNEHDYTLFGKLNRQFHQTIYEKTPYPRIYKMIFDMWDGSERTRAVFSLTKTRAQESLTEHEAILKAIVAGNVHEVEYLVREHKQRAAMALLSYLKSVENGVRIS